MGTLSSWDLSKALMSWGTPGKDINCNYRMEMHHSITNLECVRVTVQDCKSLPVAPRCLLDTRGCPLPSPPLLHTRAGQEEQPADWRHQGCKSFDTFSPRLGLERDVPATLRDQIRGMRELDRHCLLRRSLSQVLKPRKALMSSQELQRTRIEAESWELNLLVSQGTSSGNMQTLTLLQTNLSMQSQGTPSCSEWGCSSVY